MRVQLIASTMIDFHKTPWVPERDSHAEEYEGTECADALAEFAGRACYQSWERPNPATATNQTYLAHILEVDHGSVLEHASATFYVTGISRSLTHELIRHRHLSYSQLSQRFVDEQAAEVVYPPAFTAGWQRTALDRVRLLALETYRVLVEDLTINWHLTRKQAREAARAVLPNATETKIVVTGNMRAWRHVCKMRGSEHADAEIRQFAHEVLRQLKEIAPNTFQDM